MVGKAIRTACILVSYHEESGRLPAEAMKLGIPQFVDAKKAAAICRRIFQPGFRSCEYGVCQAWGESGVAKTPKRAISQSLLRVGKPSPWL